MSEKADNYLESLFQGVDILIDKKLENVSYDTTIICTVIDNTNKKNGEYMVKNDSVTYKAYSDVNSYSVGDQVRVSVPMGDFSQKKFIVGKYVDDDSTSLTYTSPTDTVVNISENLALDANNVTISGGIAANGEDNVRVLWNKTLDQEFLSLQNDNIYNRVILKANFRTTLDNYDLISGNYGLRIDFLTRPSEDSAVKIRRVLELDSDEMFGNVYHFSVKSPQSKVFIMENFGIIETVAISLYQKDNFINEDGEYIQSYENLDNIFVSDIVFGFGCDLTLLQDNAVQIYSDDNLYYKYANHTADTNEKSIKLLWLNKNENNEYTGFSDGIYDPKYDEIAYLDLARTESRLLAQKGKENVPQDKMSLNLAANIIEAKPAIEKAISIVNKDLITLLREFATKFSENPTYQRNVNELINGQTEKEPVRRLTFFTSKIENALDSSFEGKKKGLIPQYELVLKYGYQVWTDAKQKLAWGKTKDEDGKDNEYVYLWPSNEKGEKIENNNYNKIILDNFNKIGKSVEWLLDSGFEEIDSSGYKSIYDTYKIRINKLVSKMWGYLGRDSQKNPSEENNPNPYKKSFPSSVLFDTEEKENDKGEKENIIKDFLDLLSYKDKKKKNYVIYGGKDLSAYNNKYCIYWYRYEKDYEPPDTEQFLPFGWKRIDFSKEENKDIYEVIDANGKSSKDEVAEEEAKANVLNVGLSDKYIKDGEEVKNTEGKPVHSPKCSPGRGYFKKYMKNDTVQEKFMAVVFYNHVMYKSDELVFSNSENVPDVTTLEQGDILIFEHKDNSLDNYQIYGITNYLMDASAEFKFRQIRCHYDGILAKDEAFINGQLYWYVPNVLTMLSVDVGELKNKGFNLDETRTEYQYSSIELEAKNYEKDKYYILIDGKYTLCTDENFDKAKKYYERDDISTYCFYKQVQARQKTDVEIKDAIYEKDKWDFTNGTSIDNRDFWYKIKPYYSNDAINNEIKCVFEKSENPSSIQGTQFFTFGVRGTSGTKYTLEVTRKETSPASSNSEEGLKLRVRLLDANNEPVDIPQDGNRKLEVKWEWSNVKNSQPITITNRINEIDVDMPSGQYGIAKFTLIDKVTIKNANDGKDETKTLVELETLFSVPFSEITYSKETYRDIFYLKGPTQIIYNSLGTLDNNSKVDNNYKLYLKKNVIFESESYESGSDVDNLFKQKDIDVKYDIVIYGKNEADSIAGFMPKIINKALVAPPMYISGINSYAVVKVYFEQGETERILWQQPLIIIQNRYASPVLNEWDGNFQIDEKNGTILSTMVGAGRKNEKNQFSGVLMGDVGVGAKMNAGNKSGLGLYGFHEGAQSFGFNVDGTAFIGKSGKGRIEFNGNKGIIKSSSYQKNNATGMMIDVDDGIIDMKGTSDSKPTNTNLHLSVKTPYFYINNGDKKYDLMRVGDNVFYLQSQSYIDFLNKTEDPQPGIRMNLQVTKANELLFSIRGTQQPLFYIGNPLKEPKDYSFYLQTDNYSTTKKTGMRIDLKDGTINAYNFTLSGFSENGSIKLTSDPQFLVKYDGTEIINIKPIKGKFVFKLQSSDWTDDESGMSINFEKGTITAFKEKAAKKLLISANQSNYPIQLGEANLRLGWEGSIQGGKYTYKDSNNKEQTAYKWNISKDGTARFDNLIANGGTIGGINIGNGTGISGTGWSLSKGGGSLGGWSINQYSISNSKISLNSGGSITIGKTTLNANNNNSATFNTGITVQGQAIVDSLLSLGDVVIYGTLTTKSLTINDQSLETYIKAVVSGNQNFT